MQAYLTLTRRELANFFVSAKGYIIIAAVVFLMGLSFVSLLALLEGEATPVPVTQMFFSTAYFWLIVLLTGPVITMRLFALEKFTGTFETLMTTPVSDLQVVLAKFTAAIIFYMTIWIPSLGSILVLRHYLSNPDAFDAPLVASTFFGIFLVGCLFVSIGCFASSLTRSQIVASMVSFSVGFTLFLLSYLPGHLPVTLRPWQNEVLSHIALFDHMNDFARGVVDTRHVVFYASLTFLFLFLTLRAVESRRWR